MIPISDSMNLAGKNDKTRKRNLIFLNTEVNTFIFHFSESADDETEINLYRHHRTKTTTQQISALQLSSDSQFRI